MKFKSLAVPEGKVKKITSGGAVLWKSGPKNWVKYSTEADGVTIYNGGLGYKDNYRVRSGGAEQQTDGITITGFIPFVKGDKLYIYPPFTGGNTDNTINFYDASFACLGQITDGGSSYGICVNNGSKFKTKVVNGVSVLDLSDNTASGVSDIRYVRIGNNIESASPISSGADMIVTVNEEIGESVKTPTNFADPTSSDWCEGYRWSFSAQDVRTNSYHTVTNFIPAKMGDIIEVEGLSMKDASSDGEYTKFILFNASKVQESGLYGAVSSVSSDGYGDKVIVNGNKQSMTVFYGNNNTQHAAANTSFVRIDGILMSGYTKNDVVINIKRNGEYL